MVKQQRNQVDLQLYFTLLRAGLWEQDIRLLPFEINDLKESYRLAHEQSVVGLIAAGIEHVTDVKVPKFVVLKIVGDALEIERRNTAMNSFIAVLVEQLYSNGIHCILLKGQGIAQCYERPLWRSAGDVDLYLDKTDFEKAKCFFRPLVKSFDPDSEYAKSINMHYDPWIVEIHSNQHSELSTKIDKVLDEIHNNIFHYQGVRIWKNGDIEIALPSSNNDVLLLFTHIIKHLYKGGVGLRQICDWVRLLWTYRDSIDTALLMRRIKDMHLVSVWKVFASLAVDTLGMPPTAMPFYDTSQKWKKKSQRLLSYIMATGNMGHNRDTSYYGKYPYFVRKMVSLIVRVKDVICLSRIFPYDSLRFLLGITRNGVINAIRFAK